jgi:hypothetical protein
VTAFDAELPRPATHRNGPDLAHGVSLSRVDTPEEGTNMTTEKQLAANRQNAKLSTGPCTERGKAAVSRNNLRHGLYASTPIIPGLETSAQWEQHRAITVSGLNPVTQLEEALAERVALILWRLGRVARYERHVTARAQSQAPADLAAEDDPDDEHGAQQVRARFAESRRCLRAITRFRTLPPDAPLTGAEAEAILETVAQQVEDFDWPNFAVPDLFTADQSITDMTGWNVGWVRHCVKAIASASQQDADQLVEAALAAARDEHNQRRIPYRQLGRRLRDLRHERVVPQPARLDHVIRYEGHLTRQLNQTLNQLRLLQGHRSPRPTPRQTAPAYNDYHLPIDADSPPPYPQNDADPLRLLPRADDDPFLVVQTHSPIHSLRVSHPSPLVPVPPSTHPGGPGASREPALAPLSTPPTGHPAPSSTHPLAASIQSDSPASSTTSG